MRAGLHFAAAFILLSPFFTLIKVKLKKRNRKPAYKNALDVSFKNINPYMQGIISEYELAREERERLPDFIAKNIPVHKVILS